MLAALLLAGILAVSAMHPDIQELQFSTKIPQNEHCVICYGSDCLNIDENRCEYYRQTKNILKDGTENVQAEDTELRDRIDGYIMEYVHQDSWAETVCIPLVSYYTNCNRENVCTGCKTCNCDGVGRWNCTTIQPCESTASVDLNRMTLEEVLKKIKNYTKVLKGTKRKRSVIYNDGTQQEQMNSEDILELLYGIQNFEHNHKRNTTEKIITPNNINRRDNNIDSNIWDAESIRFEELLDIIDDDKNNILNLHNLPHAKLLNETYINVNTGTSNNRRNLIKNNDIFYVKSVEMPTFDYVNNFDKTRNLTKREIILEPKQAQNNTSILLHNSSTNIRELENNVLYPLFNIVNEKRMELEQLINIKDKLVIYFKSFTDINITNDASDHSDKNVNPHLYFYQLEMTAESRDDNMRKNNQNILEKYMKKLKRDIFEVIRDISNIQRLSNSSAMPQNLKVLIRAIKYYVNKEKNKSNKIIEPKFPAIVNLRKEFDADSYSKQSYPIITIHKVFNTLLTIFDSLSLIDKDVSVIKAMDPVSKGGKQILKRIIEQLYKNSIANDIYISSKALDPQHDITNLFNDIGNGRNKVITSVIKNSSSERLYCMKLLNVQVLADIKKIKRALELLQTAENRRILLVDDSIGNRIISKLGNDLKRISHLVKQIPHFQVLNTSGKLNIQPESSGTSPLNNNKTRKSFLQTIRKLLKSSKKDIRDLFHRKVPKSDIIKHIAKKKIDDMKKKKLLDYEDTMQRWQNNLNIRNKRSAGEIRNFFNRLKNIIPDYLRGKVKPAVHKKSNKSVVVGRKHSHKGHKSNKRTKLTSTTPIMYMHR